MNLDNIDPSSGGPPPEMEYVAGGEAFLAGKPDSDNPFVKGTEKHYWWDCGWADAENTASYWASLEAWR